MSTTPPPAPAGWYPDPDESGGQRYWDGTGWTGQTRPAQPAGPHEVRPFPADQHARVEPTGAGKRSPLVLTVIVASVLALVVVAGLVVYLHVGKSTHSLHIAKYPVNLAVDPGTHTVYVTHSYDATMSVIDGPTRKLTATVPIGEGPQGVAVDPGSHTVYVTNGNRVSVIDGSTNTVTATVPVGKEPDGVAVDPGTHTVYVTNRADGTMSVIDGSTNTVTATVPVGKNGAAGKDPGGVAVDPGTHTVYVANYDPGNHHGRVSVIDGSTRAVTATVPVGAPGDAVSEVAVDPGSHTVYVPNLFDGTVWVIDGSKNTVTATVPVNVPHEEGSGSDISRVVLGGGPEGVAVDPGSHAIYVTHKGPDNNVGRVSMIDGSTNTVTASVDAGGNHPTAVAVDPGTHTVYTISADSHTGAGTLWAIEFQ